MLQSDPLSADPFSLDQPDAWATWRERKLACQPRHLSDLLVEVRDPRRLTDAEHGALLARLRRANLAIYVGATGDDPDKDIPRRLGARFGLHSLDDNPGADEDAITSITVREDGFRSGYIPYTQRPISWHTDGYYNPPSRRVRAFLLHCVRPAASGGENAVMDPELLYLHLRERDPDHVRALMRADAMTIPPHSSDGIEARSAVSGPVFFTDTDGSLGMRFTDRRRNIEWRADPATTAALAALRDLLADPVVPRFQVRLEAGWGLICNNVLHSRTGFSDGQRPRLLYRARYHERIGGT